jgi:hypothetical protein
MLGDTGLAIHRIPQKGWRLSAHQRGGAVLWLHDQGLLGVDFETRAEAYRAAIAHGAGGPTLPSQPQVALIRRGSGRYVSACERFEVVLIHGARDRRWELRGLTRDARLALLGQSSSSLSPSAASLPMARRMLAVAAGLHVSDPAAS